MLSCFYSFRRTMKSFASLSSCYCCFAMTTTMNLNTACDGPCVESFGRLCYCALSSVSLLLLTLLTKTFLDIYATLHDRCPSRMNISSSCVASRDTWSCAFYYICAIVLYAYNLFVFIIEVTQHCSVELQKHFW